MAGCKSLQAIGGSIRKFGSVVPIVVDKYGKMLAGHDRYEAADAFALPEDRVAELNGWAHNLLTAELNVLFESGYELEVTGFSNADHEVPDRRAVWCRLPDSLAQAAGSAPDP